LNLWVPQGGLSALEWAWHPFQSKCLIPIFSIISFRHTSVHLKGFLMFVGVEWRLKIVWVY